MPRKISQLEAATDVTASDLIQVIDIEDTGMAISGTNKKITAGLLANNLISISTSPSFTSNTSITVNSSETAMSVTQSGAGASLSVNGSFSRFLNDGSAVNLLISTASNDNQPSYLQLRKYRGTHTSPAAVQSGDALGSNVYYGYDGNSLEAVAFFGATVDGTVSDGIIPTRFGFTTENSSGVLSEKMRITSAGDVGIGTTSPSSKLHVAGDLTVSSATTANSATAGTNGDVPAQVVGYLVVSINGTSRKIPYYA